MSKSIVQPALKECLLCRRDAEEAGYYGILSAAGLHKHHIMFGTSNRKLSEKFGVWCWLCPGHHEFGPEAVHRCRETDLYLKKLAQTRFEEIYSHEKWMEVFSKNYLSSETNSQEAVKKSQEVGFWFIDEGE